MYDTRILGLHVGFRGLEISIDRIAHWREHHEGDDNRAEWLADAKRYHADVSKAAINRVDLATGGALNVPWFHAALVTATRAVKVAERLASSTWDKLDVDAEQAEWLELRQQIRRIVEEVNAARPFVGDAAAGESTDDDKNYMPAKECLGLEFGVTYGNLPSILEKEGIRNKPKGKNRRIVHAGDWKAYERKRRAEIEAAQSTPAIERVVEAQAARYEQIKGQKGKKSSGPTLNLLTSKLRKGRES